MAVARPGWGTRVEIDVVGDREFARDLLGLAVGALSLKHVFEEVLEKLREVVRQQYSTNGFRGNTPWKPLNAVYRAEKIRRGLDPRIMLATHKLYNSLAHHTSDSIAEVTDDSLTFGSDAATKKGDRYLKYHQSRKPRKKLPRRPVLALTEMDRVEIVGMFRSEIVKARRRQL